MLTITAPPAFDSVSGIIGHENVVRDAEHVLIIGGGQGTEAEAQLALAMKKKLLPMPASGGTAAQVYASLEHEADHRKWLSVEAFTELRTAGPAEYVRIVDEALSQPASQRKDT